MIVQSASAATRTPAVSSRTHELVLKRSFDVCVSAISLICLLPVLVLAMIAICLESAGSPIFVQQRVGRNGQVFSIYKLRTMFVGSDSIHYRTIAGDRRLTKTGTLLRRLNIDELPQLVNILLGQMSVIGPRPLSVSEINFLINSGDFSSDHPGLIPSFRPGLVGLEQVNRSVDLTYTQRFTFNDDYEREFSTGLDLAILAKSMAQCAPICAIVAMGASFSLIGAVVLFQSKLP